MTKKEELVEVIAWELALARSACTSEGVPSAYDFERAKLILKRITDPYVEALIWCSAADDFAPNGKARVGYDNLVRPLLP